MVWQCYRRGGFSGKTMADMMRLGLREEGEKSWDELLMAQQVWTPLGNTGWGSGGGGSPLRKGQREEERESVLTFPCFVCVSSACHVSYCTTHNDSQCHSCQSTPRRLSENTFFIPVWNASGQSNGKSSCVTIRCIVNNESCQCFSGRLRLNQQSWLWGGLAL